MLIALNMHSPVCYCCGQVGHLQTNCRFKKQRPQYSGYRYPRNARGENDFFKCGFKLRPSYIHGTRSWCELKNRKDRAPLRRFPTHKLGLDETRNGTPRNHSLIVSFVRGEIYIERVPLKQNKTDDYGYKNTIRRPVQNAVVKCKNGHNENRPQRNCLWRASDLCRKQTSCRTFDSRSNIRKHGIKCVCNVHRPTKAGLNQFGAKSKSVKFEARQNREFVHDPCRRIGLITTKVINLFLLVITLMLTSYIFGKCLKRIFQVDIQEPKDIKYLAHFDTQARNRI